MVWNYPVPLFGKKQAGGHGLEAFGNKIYNAVRLPNGNTLIATGNGHSILEVTPEKEIVWKVEQNDLQDISLAWVTSLEVLPNGNIMIGNCHAGPDNPQFIEITRERKSFGPSTISKTLAIPQRHLQPLVSKVFCDKTYSSLGSAIRSVGMCETDSINLNG